MNSLIMSALLALAVSVVTHAATRQVPAQYATIQEAILACSHGDTVIVAEGTYVENINFRGRNIVVGSHYLLDGDVVHASRTIIDGSQPAHSDTGSVVSIISGEDSTTALIGFSITGGTGTKFRDQSDNLFYVEGGGVIVENSYPLITHNYIHHNEAMRDPPGVTSSGGGGIRIGYCNVRIFNNVIMHNSGKYGGGVVCFFANGDLKNNVIANNSGGEDYGGGGVWTGGSGYSTLLMNNTIVGNESVLSGGGVRAFNATIASFSNIIWGNRANSGSQQIGGTGATSVYSCVQGGFPGFGNINVFPEFTPQGLMLSPLSVCIDAGHPDSMWFDEDGTRNDMGCYGGPRAGSFAQFGEPIIHMSTNEIEFSFSDRLRHVLVVNRGTSLLSIDSITTEWIEIVGLPPELAPVYSDTISLLGPETGSPHIPGYDTLLVYHRALNMENPVRVPLLVPADVAADLTMILPTDFALHPAYPNPFNPSTTISFALPTGQLVSLAITDIQGRQVEELFNSRLPAGEHTVEWNANSFASGTYFAALRAGKWHAQIKLTLLK